MKTNITSVLIFIFVSFCVMNLVAHAEHWMDYYKTDSYEKFTIPASESGLDGSMLKVVGKVENILPVGEYNAIFINNYKNEKWILSAGEHSNFSIGSEITAYGFFTGYSAKYSAPSLFLLRYTYDENTLESTFSGVGLSGLYEGLSFDEIHEMLRMEENNVNTPMPTYDINASQPPEHLKTSKENDEVSVSRSPYTVVELLFIATLLLVGVLFAISRTKKNTLSEARAPKEKSCLSQPSPYKKCFICRRPNVPLDEGNCCPACSENMHPDTQTLHSAKEFHDMISQTYALLPDNYKYELDRLPEDQLKSTIDACKILVELLPSWKEYRFFDKVFRENCIPSEKLSGFSNHPIFKCLVAQDNYIPPNYDEYFSKLVKEINSLQTNCILVPYRKNKKLNSSELPLHSNDAIRKSISVEMIERRPQGEGFRSFILTGNSNCEMQEHILYCSVQDEVIFDYDYEKEKYLVLSGMDIGYLPKSAENLLEDNYGAYSEAFISEISENSNGKYKVKVMIKF